MLGGPSLAKRYKPAVCVPPPIIPYPVVGVVFTSVQAVPLYSSALLVGAVPSCPVAFTPAVKVPKLAIPYAGLLTFPPAVHELPSYSSVAAG